MEALVDAGLVKHIGVSNFTQERVQHLLDNAKIKPAVNQVELNLRCAQKGLVEVRGKLTGGEDESFILTSGAHAQWSKKNGILLESYSPLGSTGAPQLEDKVVRKHSYSM